MISDQKIFFLFFIGFFVSATNGQNEKSEESPSRNILQSRHGSSGNPQTGFWSSREIESSQNNKLTQRGSLTNSGSAIRGFKNVQAGSFSFGSSNQKGSQWNQRGSSGFDSGRVGKDKNTKIGLWDSQGSRNSLTGSWNQRGSSGFDSGRVGKDKNTKIGVWDSQGSRNSPTGSWNQRGFN